MTSQLRDRTDGVAAGAAYAAAVDAARRMAADAPDDAVTRQILGYLEERLALAAKLLASMK